MYTISDLFDLTHTKAYAYLSNFTYPYQALSGLKQFIITLGESLDENYEEISPKVWVHKSANIFPTAYIGAPCIIGAHTEVRHGAFIRGSALIGEDCVVGNSTEIKNAILFDGVQVPHYNYIGDSILGYKAHTGAGVITSNVKSDKSLVVIKDGEEKMPTALKKVGAMLGDFAEIGCNSVLNPGAVVGRGASVYPLSCVRGTVKANGIYKNANEIVDRE